MRKLASGLWHVARDEACAPTKLFNVSGKAAYEHDELHLNTFQSENTCVQESL